MASTINASTSAGLISTGDTSGVLALQTNSGTTAVTIDTSQKVGIGTASPSALLHVSSTSAETLRFQSTSSAPYQTFYNSSANRAGYMEWNTSALKIDAESGASSTMAFLTANNERMRIDSSGNVGIGTASPTSLLTVHNGSVLLRSAVTTGALNSYTLGFSATATGGAAAYLTSYRENANDASALVFGTWNGSAAGERMRIDSSGLLLVNRTSASGTSRLQVSGISGTAAAIETFHTATTSQNHIQFNNGSVVGTISTNGSSTAYNTSSDYRLKENIAPMTGALAKVAQLKPVTYKWKVDGSDGEGFIAHELAEVCPHAVNGEKDAVDAEGNPRYQGIDVSFLVATLTAALQETKALIDQQAETINALTARVVALEGQ